MTDCLKEQVEKMHGLLESYVCTSAISSTSITCFIITEMNNVMSFLLPSSSLANSTPL
jgi:hypothetical protein